MKGSLDGSTDPSRQQKLIAMLVARLMLERIGEADFEIYRQQFTGMLPRRDGEAKKAVEAIGQRDCYSGHWLEAVAYPAGGIGANHR